MASFSQSQIEHFKREAKKICRASDCLHSEALDRIANSNGYRNWSLLVKNNDPKDTTKAERARNSFRFTRSPELMHMALLKVPEPGRYSNITRSEEAKSKVNNISKNFISAQNSVEFAISYMTCLLQVKRFKIYSTSIAYWEMRFWLPYSCYMVKDCAYLFLNRHYKPVGYTGNDWVKYEEFSDLLTRFQSDNLGKFTAQGSSHGYLFNDGCTPWNSRKDAITYLERLKILNEIIEYQNK